ncbi:MAG: tRNA preQ1(34) S-adenosylmethionine ribosyltransferase-isomerase QueA [Saprospiraceae bacterium]|nr:tRNA preQ1(34) S-adenosylmethionine ribosyltransferase-isomerase QueA [Saprospiraceae bacterium]HMW39187.1 tRNA preQ1(34) S-adenosylmethionine ribosyltransferase-isomerase QueA [Saprospiraceae bacterium]HMX89287.1 tRNA preQ1(34) S-adenosylmethionine ribosyltransferase-isomerase QueA [Saprospiraceae bacterium]HMZ40609.1 tRNA preQ1(34) S-adenosylmethionine ribosyltransferase-isomerase QueA [Saprospiraceae bacterium]HNA63707.1 tRNA preQ1(34) S-adenosylmethionine ribosyltransferase-isomerase Que
MRTKLSNFDFNLPKNLVAQYPASERTESRLMVIHRSSGKIEHKLFKDILDYVEDKDAMIINNTKVFPARLYGKKEKTGAKIEVFLLRELNKAVGLWDVLVDPARKIRVGNKLYFYDKNNKEVLAAEVVDNTTSRGRTIRFLHDGDEESFQAILRLLGQTPLPKYITRNSESSDIERYQTVYAKEVGAVAAPTAGLHFSRELCKMIEIKGGYFGEVTLHVGMGTFRTIDVEDLSKHKMEAEYFRIPQETADLINKTKAAGRNVTCVGTTTMRALESNVTASKQLRAGEGWTNLFVYPPYEFSIANRMITNFHQPKSSLLIMVSAFAGHELLMDAYQVAIKEKYRFYSYGDAMLII